MAMSVAEIQDVLDEKGLPAAVRVLVRVYNESEVENPWSGFWPPFAVASVHVARWTLGHDKNGEKRFEPKSVTDPRFKKLVSQLIPPGGTVEALVMTLAEGAALELSRILHMEEVIAEEEVDEEEQAKRDRIIARLEAMDAEAAELEQDRLDEIALREEKEVIQLLG